MGHTPVGSCMPQSSFRTLHHLEKMCYCQATPVAICFICCNVPTLAPARPTPKSTPRPGLSVSADFLRRGKIPERAPLIAEWHATFKVAADPWVTIFRFQFKQSQLRSTKSRLEDAINPNSRPGQGKRLRRSRQNIRARCEGGSESVETLKSALLNKGVCYIIFLVY